MIVSTVFQKFTKRTYEQWRKGM